MEKQIAEIAAEYGIRPDDADGMRALYEKGNFAGSFKQKVDTLMISASAEFCPLYEYISC